MVKNMELLKTIYSDGSTLFVSNQFPKKDETISIRLRMDENLVPNNVFLQTTFFGAHALIQMQKNETINGLSYYACNIKIEQKEIEYTFVIKIGPKLYYLNQKGLFDYIPNNFYSFKIITDYKYPFWVKNSNFYQIFPDRFNNGVKSNDVKDNEYFFDGHPTISRKWNDPVLNYNQSFCLDFYNGDLDGIIQKIDYLKSLGINAIYINPIFKAATIHRYDCADYFEVDEHLGGNKALIRLVNELHDNNFHIIVDVSINHTGRESKWFNKDLTFYPKELGSYFNKDSKERSYYFFNNDNTFIAWANVATLPQLNYGSNDLRNIIYKDQDSLVKHYLKAPYNIDGWRFDVADMMARNSIAEYHKEIWPEIVKSIKETKKDAYVIGECWCDPEDYVGVDVWDSAMNYIGCASPIRDYIGCGDCLMSRNPTLHNFSLTGDALALKNRIEEHFCKLPFVMQQVEFNLLDSHDVPRFHNFPNINHKIVKIAAILQYSLIGTPSLYYGDELYIKGDVSSNEGCRYPMPWNEDYKKIEEYNLYKVLNNLRLTKTVFTDGGMKIFANGSVIGIFRFNADEAYLSLANMGDTTTATISLAELGNNFIIPDRDVFNEQIPYMIKDKNYIISIKKEQSFLIKL